MPEGESRALAVGLGRLLALERRVREAASSLQARENVPGTDTLLEALRLACEEGRRRLESAIAVPDDADGHDTGKGPLHLVNHLQGVGGYILGQIAPTHGDDFDMLILPFGRLVRYVSPRTEVVFHPVEERQYRVSDEVLTLLRDWADDFEAEELAAELAELPRVVVMDYPALAEADVFQHAQLAHEVAHLVLRESAPGESRNHGEAIFEKRFAAVERKLHCGTGDVPAAHKRLSRWFRELASDRVGLALIGPALFFALHEYAMAEDRWTTESHFHAYESHPHLAWRLERLAGYAESYFPSVGVPDDAPDPEPLAEALRAGREELVARRDAIPAYDVDAKERDLLEAALGDLEDRLPELVDADAGYRPDKFFGSAGHIWLRLESRIPPADRLEPAVVAAGEDPAKAVWTRGESWSRPVSWRGILNVGYVRHLHKVGEAPDSLAAGEDAVKQRAAHANYVRRSIELSELLKLASERRADAVPLVDAEA